MAIALRGTLNDFTANNNNGNDVTLTYDTITPPLEDDIIIVFGGHANTATALSPPSGNISGNYIQLGIQTGSGAIFGAWYQRMGSTPDTSVTCDGGGNAADGVQYGTYVLSGVDAATALDTAATTAGPTTSTNPDCPSITTVTTDAWVFAMAGSNNRDISVTAPTGYTDFLSSSRQETNDATVAGARIDAGATGAEDPPAFTTWISGPWYAITAAFRPATGGGNQSIVVGQITENVSLFAIAVVTAISIITGLITENESLFAATPVFTNTITVGQITENESLFAATPVPSNTITVGQITENESLFAVTSKITSPFFEVSLSSNIPTSGIDTTDRLTGGNTHDGGRLQDDENPADTVDLAADRSGEWAWNLLGTGAIAGDQYSFRLVLADDTLLDTYTVEPKWTIPSGGAQSISVGLITENESLFAATPVPVISVTTGLITENESLFAVTPVPSNVISVGLITENESLFAASIILGGISITTGLITENESLFSPAVIQGEIVSVGLITENESLFVATPAPGGTSISVGQITENESLFVATPVPSNTITVGQITENESLFVATPVPGEVFITTGLITENESLFAATPVPGVFSVTTGLITENESLFSPSISQGEVVAVGQITENESLFVTTPVPGGISISVGLITENENLFSATPVQVQIISVGQITENESLFVTTPVPGGNSITVGLITENESLFAAAVILDQSITVGLLTENESLFAAALIPGETSITVGLITENESLFAVVVFQPGVFSGGVYNAQAEFTTGGTVTITIYDTATGLVVATDSDVCNEFASTGSYVWGSQNLTVEPAGYKEYGFEMTNGTLFKKGIMLVNTGLLAAQDTKLTRIHALLDVIEGSYDHAEVQRILLAAMAGLASGAAGTNMKFRDVADTKDRIDATVDDDGNRTAITLDATP